MKTRNTPMIAAHRGSAGGNIPCNTESAFLAALNQGADIIELDVSVSRDKKLFVFHPGKEYCYLSSSRPIATLSAKQVEKRKIINTDGSKTTEKLLTLDEGLELLKNKCLINVDKFWTAPKIIADCIRRHNMTEQIIIKTDAKEHWFRAVEETAPEIPYMAIVHAEDTVSKTLIDRKLNYIGIEAIFTSDKLPIVSDEHIAFLHEKGLKIWGNAIVYNYKDVLSDCHTDDTAMRGNPDIGWGWFADKGFDIVQTDWVLPMNLYFKEKGCLSCHSKP